ncbi:MAG: HlyD family efflux transporter periplasmic adaptor subunit [Verrucomicrobia subdivision 3 bacterium]|nr:HlyD family efflux transporter periplasmic adaptor subunit [Limisphaerales bacterium]
MQIEHPRIRGDLVVSPQQDAEATIYVVKDPVRGRFFRFRETEYFITRQLDGETPADDVCRRVGDKYGAALKQEQLAQFVDRLRNCGLLADGNCSPARPRRVLGDLFYLRFKAFDPDRFLNWLVGRVRFLFTPQFVALSAGLILTGMGITLTNWPEITHQFQGLFRLESLLAAWAICIVVIGFHEIAHGLTCKYFGGSVRELGFMLIYFQPAFYCNVSDSWLFAQKARRLWVTFAGAYFEMFLWAAATIVWRITEPGTAINSLALIVSATSAIKSFFNLNPLIKLDGYYLLSDWLNVPNLRQRAFAWLRGLPGRCWRRLASQATPRERRIYFWYGTLAFSYTSWLLWVIASNASGYLTERYGAWGFVCFSALLAGVFRYSIRDAVRSLRGESTGAKSRGRRAMRWAKLALIGGAIGALLFYAPMELRVPGEFVVLPSHNADVRAEVTAIIHEIFRDEGEAVRAGDVIARLSDRDFRAELQKTAAEIAEKEARLKLLRAGARPQEIQLAKTTAAKAEERVKFAATEMERNRALFQERLLSQKDFEQAQELVSLRRKEFEEATNQLAVIYAGTRPEEIEATEAALNRLVAQRGYLEEQLRLLTVTSPVAGVITTRKLKERVGQLVEKGDLIAEVHELQTVRAEIAIAEKEIGDVKAGQKVVLKARAYPNLVFAGTVKSIAPIATKAEEWRNDRTVIVTTELDNTSGLLKSAMTGRAKISCGEIRMIDLLTRRLARYVRVEFWSWW